MEMTSLRELHQSMRDQALDIQQFRVKTGATEFHCIFSVREIPYCLALTSRGANPKFIKFEVKEGYWIANYLGDQYADLREALFVDGHTGQQIIPKIFLEQLNRAIPRTAFIRNIPTPVDIVANRNDIEDRDRPHFDRWEQRGRGPTLENLKKTLIILGKEAHDLSILINMSSIWSADDKGRDWRYVAKRAPHGV